MPKGLSLIFVIFLTLAAAGSAHAAVWLDNHWTFRRPVNVYIDPTKSAGGETAQVEFYTAGHQLPNGQDIRIATADGRLVPSRVLEVGPGDKIRLAFNLAKGVRFYYVYFGNPKPAPPPPNLPEFKVTTGLLLEMKQWNGGGDHDFRQIETAWKQAKPAIGGILIDRPFLGLNLLGDQPRYISRITGSLFAPRDGDYQFAVSAHSKGALYIDGKPLIFAQRLVRDIRFNATIPLKRGPHSFLLYHANTGGNGRFSVGWKTPDMTKVDIIPKEAFGLVQATSAGPLEQFGKTLTADFKVEYEGECFIAGHYTHRLKFTAISNLPGRLEYEWDFGDGQTSNAVAVDHVYLTEKIYPVRLIVHLSSNSDTQTSKVGVARDYPHLDHPPTDKPPVQAGIIAEYDINKMPADWLPWAMWLHMEAGRPDLAIAVGRRMASEKHVPDSAQSLRVLTELTEQSLLGGHGDETMRLWDRIPSNSNLQPAATKMQERFLLWWTADLPKALSLLEAHHSANDDLQRLYAQALVLNEKADEGRKILQSLPIHGRPEIQAVMSGSFARTIEGYIDQKDWRAAEDEWDEWQSHYPADFLEGYSVLL